MNNSLKVLAVGDPAVNVYIDPNFSIVDRFNQEHHVKVDFQIIPWNNYYGKMIEVLEQKQEVDIVMVAGHLWIKDFVMRDYLAKVHYPKTNEYDKQDLLKVIRKEMEVDGVPYLYPSFCDGHILIYRKSLVKHLLGYDLPEAVDTDMILNLSKKLDGVGGMRGIALKAHQSEIFLDFIPYLRQEGTDAFDEITHKPIFNNKKGITALKKYLSLKNFSPENTFTYGNDEVRKAFQQKKVAQAVTWGGQLGVVLDKRCIDVNDVGFAALKTSWNVTWSFAIRKDSPNQELANQFLAYLTSKEVDQLIGGYAGSPVRKSTYLKDINKYKWYNVHLQLIEKYAKPLPTMGKAGDKMSPLYYHLHQAFIGNETAEEALKRAEEEIMQVEG
ncbi:ABC transporter substrate-binding protein [Caldifermentibacillus hisashii]|uniref:ABC transporter substrate-binding protein n=1 Tax=Caldifermentibacillus hisashii TaxID=996558 RepID=UPI00310173AF